MGHRHSGHPAIQIQLRTQRKTAALHDNYNEGRTLTGLRQNDTHVAPGADYPLFGSIIGF